MSTKAQIFQALLAGLRFDGAAAASHVVYFVTAGTAPSIASLKSIYLDAAKTTPAANPYTLDANGQAGLFLDGNYDVIVKTAVGGTIKAQWENVQLGLDAVSALNIDERDCTAGLVTVTPVAANNSAATTILYRKIRSDTSGNALRIAPEAGTVNGETYIDLTIGGESALIVPVASENDYLVI